MCHREVRLTGGNIRDEKAVVRLNNQRANTRFWPEFNGSHPLQHLVDSRTTLATPDEIVDLIEELLQ